MWRCTITRFSRVSLSCLKEAGGVHENQTACYLWEQCRAMLTHITWDPDCWDPTLSLGQPCWLLLTSQCLGFFICKMGLMCVRHSELYLLIKLAFIILTLTLHTWKWCNRCSKSTYFPLPILLRELFQGVSGYQLLISRHLENVSVTNIVFALVAM